MSKGFGAKKGEEVSTEPVYDPNVVEARLKKWFPELSQAVVSNLVFFQTELIRFNKTINLVSPSTLRNAEAVHIADSVLASRLMAKNMTGEAALYDFGSGNGFPGVVFALLYPERKVVIVDRDQRKLEFCKHIASHTRLSNISFVASGVEELPIRSVTYLVSRGSAPLQKAMLQCRKQVIQGGKFFHLKSDAWANELAQVPSQLFTYWSPSLVGQYKIPDSSAQMSVVLTEKTAD